LTIIFDNGLLVFAGTRTHQKRELATLKILSLVGIPGTVCTLSVNGFAAPAFELDLLDFFTFTHQADFSG
jgi:hypothetical protein